MTMFVQRLPMVSELPFDLSFLRAHLRLDYIEEDALVSSMAKAVAAELEHSASVALLTQQVTVTLDDLTRRSVLVLPIAPIIDPLSVDVTADAVAFDDFAVIGGLRPAIRFTADKPCGPIVISYHAGFGDTSQDVPEDIRMAIADQVALMFRMRGETDGKTFGMSSQMARVVARYRRVST